MIALQIYDGDKCCKIVHIKCCASCLLILFVARQLVSCSRQTFAFARDGGLPFSRYLYKINPSTRTPVNCVWASAAAGLLLGLLAFAGPSAINAIFSLAIIGQYIAFSVPVACRLLGGVPWTPGPFTLGKFVSYTGVFGE